MRRTSLRAGQLGVRQSLFVALTLLAFVSCKPQLEDSYQPTPYELPTPLFFPSVNNIPQDNPMTVEGVALGELLFTEGVPRRDAKDQEGASNREGTPSGCAACHHKEYSFEGGPEATLEHLGTAHTMLPLINLAWNTTGLGWKSQVPTLEEMVYAAYTDPLEINADTNKVVQWLKQSEVYPALFKKAFGTDEITFVLVEKAIAQYVRSLVFADSKFDRYLRGEEQLSQDELNGYRLFITENGADCFHCHGGGGLALMTTNLFYNNGLDDEFNDPEDRSAVTGSQRDKGAYKAPTLRNIAVSAPYMHDGRFQTLDEVIDFYSEGVKNSENINPLMHHVMDGGVRLTDMEKAQLKAFLNTLTDETFLNNPAYSRP